MDDKVIDAIVDGRAFISDNGCVLTADEVFFDYHSETDFSMDYLDREDSIQQLLQPDHREGGNR